MDFKKIEEKLNEFNEKLNNIGGQVSDALNSGFSSFDSALNSVVDSFDEATDDLAVKYDEMKAKNENKEEKELVEPFDNSNLGQGAGDMTSVDTVVKPVISSDMQVNGVEGSVLNQASIDTGLVMEAPQKPIPIVDSQPTVVLDKVEEQVVPMVNLEKSEGV